MRKFGVMCVLVVAALLAPAFAQQKPPARKPATAVRHSYDVQWQLDRLGIRIDETNNDREDAINTLERKVSDAELSMQRQSSIQASDARVMELKLEELNGKIETLERKIRFQSY